MTGADLTRALNRNRSERTTISKDLKQGLLKLRKSLALAKKEYDLLSEERSAADARREERWPNGPREGEPLDYGRKKEEGEN